MPIIDVSGYCPVCREQKLHLMPSTMIVCLNPECPDQGAMQRIMNDPEWDWKGLSAND